MKGEEDGRGTHAVRVGRQRVEKANSVQARHISVDVGRPMNVLSLMFGIGPHGR